MNKLLLSLALLSTLSVSANSITMKMHFDGVETYRVQGNELIGESSLVEGKISLKGLVDGEKVNFSQKIPQFKDSNSMTMILTGKKRLRMIDEEIDFNASVTAKIKKSLFGKVKTITISAENYLTAMQPILKKAGLDTLQEFNLSVDKGSISTDIKTSDLTCITVAKNEMECKNSIDIIMNIDIK